jgi:RNA polymerase sigma factor (sigma-70 family)
MTVTAAEVVTTSAASAVELAGRPNYGAAGARLSELFARHGTTVLRLCWMLLRHREEAEDAVQQTFLSAYRSLLNGAEPRHPGAWLATIARNECRSRVEQRMREPLGDADAGAEAESRLPDPVTAAAAKSDLAELWRAIGELPRQQRRALLLREFSGLSYGELAAALAVSEPAVQSLLFRARREVRLRLKPAYSSISGVAPLAAIREMFARAIGGMPDPAGAGALAKVAAAPVVAKLATSAAAVVVAGGTVAAVESGVIGGSKRLAADPVADVAAVPAFRSPVHARARVVAVATAAAPKVNHLFRTPAIRPSPRQALAGSPVKAPPKPWSSEGQVSAAATPVGSPPGEALLPVPPAAAAPVSTPASAVEPSGSPPSSGDEPVASREVQGSGKGSGSEGFGSGSGSEGFGSGSGSEGFGSGSGSEGSGAEEPGEDGSGSGTVGQGGGDGSGAESGDGEGTGSSDSSVTAEGSGDSVSLAAVEHDGDSSDSESVGIGISGSGGGGDD